MNTESVTNCYTNGDGSPIVGRILDQKSGMYNWFWLRVYGVEYFFAPKFQLLLNSVGALVMETDKRFCNS